MDVRELTFEDQQFDLIFDKALFDTLCVNFYQYKLIMLIIKYYYDNNNYYYNKHE